MPSSLYTPLVLRMAQINTLSIIAISIIMITHYQAFQYRMIVIIIIISSGRFLYRSIIIISVN